MTVTMAAPEVHATQVGGVVVWAAYKPAVPLLRAAVRFSGPPGPATATVREGGPAGRATSWAALTVLDRGSLRREVSELAADVEVTPDPAGFTLTLTVAAQDAGRLLDLVGDLLGSHAFDVDPEGAAVRRMQALTAVEATQPGGMARRAALAVLYGEGHPFAEPLPELATLDGSAWWAAATPVSVTLVGAADPADLIGRLTGPADSRRPEQLAPPVRGSGWVAVPRPGSEQSAIRVAVPVPALGAPDRAAAELLSELIGGGWTSRLRLELREKRGWGYHPACVVADRPGCAHLELEADVATEVTAEATDVVRAVLASLTEPVPTKELETARQSRLGELRSELDTQSGTSRLLTALAGAGLPAHDLGRQLADLQQVTAEQVAALARAAFAADRVAGAVAGEP